MAGDEDRPTRCAGCGTSLSGTDTIEVTVRRDDAERTTVLCAACATVDCVGCGNAVSIETPLSGGDDVWDSVDLFQCVKCETRSGPATSSSCPTRPTLDTESASAPTASRTSPFPPTSA